MKDKLNRLVAPLVDKDDILQVAGRILISAALAQRIGVNVADVYEALHSGKDTISFDDAGVMVDIAIDAALIISYDNGKLNTH